METPQASPVAQHHFGATAQATHFARLICMRYLSIQIDTDLCSSLNLSEVVDHCRQLGRYPELDYPDESEASSFVYLNFFTEKMEVLWQDLSSGLFNHPELGKALSASSIVVCEVSEGSKDFLLLHHFDENEQLDSL